MGADEETKPQLSLGQALPLPGQVALAATPAWAPDSVGPYIKSSEAFCWKTKALNLLRNILRKFLRGVMEEACEHRLETLEVALSGWGGSCLVAAWSRIGRIYQHSHAPLLSPFLHLSILKVQVSLPGV